MLYLSILIFATLAVLSAVLVVGWLRRRSATRASAQLHWALAQRISAVAQAAPDLATALRDIGESLHQSLGTRAWQAMRVVDWDGQTARVQTLHAASRDRTDRRLDAYVVDSSASPLLRALLEQRPVVDAAARLIAIPVILGDRHPTALLALDTPKVQRHDLAPLLMMVAQQLAIVAQRESDHQHMAQHAAQIGRLALVAARMNNGVAIVDAQGTIEWINPTLLTLTGWQERDTVGLALIDMLSHHVQAPSTIAELQQHMQSGESFRMSYKARRHSESDSSVYWSEIDAFVVLDELGQRQQHILVLTDITQRKTQDDQREQASAFQEALLANLPVSLFVTEPESGTIVTINHHAEREFNLLRDKVVGHTIQRAMGAEILQRVQAHMQTAATSSQPIEHDFSWQDRVINARHFAVRHADGRPRLCISLVRDITGPQRALMDLEESERRFRELVESLDDAIYVTDGGRAQNLYLSPQAATMLGTSASDAPSMSEWLRSSVIEEDEATLAHQEDQERQNEPTDSLLRLDIPGHGRRWMRHKTRSRRLLSGESRIYGLLSDITEDRQQALELRHARDQAEAASLAKSQFMANMSHEIRTPMNGILGMTELLLGTELADKQRRFAQSVYRSGESLLEIVNDILDFATIEAGHVALSNSTFALRPLVEDVLELMAPRAHERGLELCFRERPSVPQLIQTDASRLRQILTNLVANAIKFTEHGEVVIDIGQDEPSGAAPAAESDEAPTLTFRVRDTGIGIKPESLPHIFKAFEQGQGDAARRYGGTGLGLPISKQLVELMGGKLHVTSKPAVGSEFAFAIPVAGADTPVVNDTPAEPAMAAGTVLVVDDNATQRAVMTQTLTDWGLKVVQADSGRQALDLLLSDATIDQDIDLALVDMHMPELDGLSMVEILRRSRRYPSLKLILLSTQATADESQRAHDAGFATVLRKPPRKAELRHTIQSLSEIEPQALARAKVGQHKRVLVVEDNPVNQEVCAQMLRRLGCDARVASSALEGLRRLGEQRYDLVLMDIQMPGMDGIEALTWFRKGSGKRFTFVNEPTTPVIAVTANALEGDEQRFVKLGFDDYLSKPFRQGQLQQMLLMHTGRPALEENTPPTIPGGNNPHPAPSSSATERPSETPLLDPNTLRRLLELDPKGENHLLERVTRAFETSLARLLPQLSEAEQHNDLSTVAHVAHTLKSSSASIGALNLSQMCADIEGIIRRQTGEDLSTRIREIPLEAERVHAGLQYMLETQP